MILMLRYMEFGLSNIEVPDETSLCIYISGCLNKCRNCHYPELQSADEGELLSKYFKDIIMLYESMFTCVCFLGEGDISAESRNELLKYTEYIRNKGLKSCLYSGRDTDVEAWMKAFDYVKTGSYKEEYGSLYKRTTNQRFYAILNDDIIDITAKFRDIESS